MHKFDVKNMDKLDNPQRRKSMPPMETLQKFNLQPGATFLDVGCGIGYFSEAASDLLPTGRVIGIDLREELLLLARERAGDRRNIEYLSSEEYAFPMEDHSADYVFIANVFHEIEDRRGFLHEVARVLKPTGYLCMIEWKKKPMEMGPPLSERISGEEAIDVMQEEELFYGEEIVINEGHYGMIFHRRG